MFYSCRIANIALLPYKYRGATTVLQDRWANLMVSSPNFYRSCDSVDALAVTDIPSPPYKGCKVIPGFSYWTFTKFPCGRWDYSLVEDKECVKGEATKNAHHVFYDFIFCTYPIFKFQNDSSILMLRDHNRDNVYELFNTYQIMSWTRQNSSFH